MRTGAKERDGGFALVVVLWIVALLALQVGIFNLAVRDAASLAGNELAIARGEALAAAGVELAAARLMETDPAWQWQESPDAGKTWTDINGQQNLSTTVHPTLPGVYMYRISVAERQNIGLAGCRVASAPITVNLHTTPTPAIQATTPLCNGKPWQLFATGGNRWEWTGPRATWRGGRARSTTAPRRPAGCRRRDCR